MLLVKVGNGRHAFENIVFVLGFDMFPKTAILAVFTQNEVQKNILCEQIVEAEKGFR